MSKKKIITPFIIFLLSVLMLFSTCIMSLFCNNEKQIAEAETAKEQTSLFDGVLKLVGQKGAGIIKSKLPAVGDYLCAQIFDYYGIDYTDSYTKEIRKINAKLNEIQTDLQTILSNQTKQLSQNTICELFNTVDTFSIKVHPIYVGYNELLRNEKDNKLIGEQAAVSEKKFYENNLKNLKFGSGESNGDLYLQLDMLLNKIITPNKSVNKTLMEHYIISYEYLWAFNTQSFAPKKEFLGYLSTSALEGLMLYTFNYMYEWNAAKADNDSAQQSVLEAQWQKIETDAEKALDYLQKEITSVEAEKKKSDEENTTTHYKTNTKVSKDLFVGELIGKSSYFVYTKMYKLSRTSWDYFEFNVLNNRAFVNALEADFSKYKVNYKKDSSFTFVQFLQACGFSCDNWNGITGIYKGQNYKHTGNTLTTEHWYFNLEYTDLKGSGTSFCYGEIKQRVWQAPRSYLKNGYNNSFAAFVLPSGYLMGQYDVLYDNCGTVADSVHCEIMCFPKDYKTCISNNTVGKVR